MDSGTKQGCCPPWLRLSITVPMILATVPAKALTQEKEMRDSEWKYKTISIHNPWHPIQNPREPSGDPYLWTSEISNTLIQKKLMGCPGGSVG